MVPQADDEQQEKPMQVHRPQPFVDRR